MINLTKMITLKHYIKSFGISVMIYFKLNI